MKEFWQGGRGTRGYVYSLIYVGIIGILLLTYFNYPNFIANFLTNPINNNELLNFIGKLIFIILSLIFVNAPRIYWWYTRNEFNDWVYKYYDLLDYFDKTSCYGNKISLDYKLKQIEHRRKKFDDNQQLAMAIWIAGIAIFSAIFINGIVNSNFLNNDDLYDNLKFDINQEYLVDSKREIKEGVGGLIVFEDPTLTKPIKVIKTGETIALTGIISSSKKDENKVNVQILYPLTSTEPLGWVEPKNLTLIDNEN